MATSNQPFATVLVPYDGSEPAQAALAHALGLKDRVTTFVIVTVVDETPVISQSATTVTAYDPTPLFEALDEQGRAVLADATARCAEAGVTPLTEIVHDAPVPGILATMERHHVDLVVMGTHARTGVARTFLGSTTEGLLRSSEVPVLAIRTGEAVTPAPFARALVGIDDSEPSDEAVTVAAGLVHAYGTHLVACYAFDSTSLYENAVSYGFDPVPLLRDMRADGEGIVTRALARASLAASGATIAVVEGKPSSAVLEAATQHHATVIVLGSHGRRGLRRFFLGSVAENIIRRSQITVLVVRNTRR
jgi:nucleotide-binding universal stress UspA family protein